MKLTRALHRGWNRFLGTFTGHRREQEFADEFESHIAMQVDDNIRAGMSPDDARRAAILKFGSIASSQEGLRDQRGLPRLESLLKDLRYAARGLRKSSAFTTVVVITLALGIGANTAIFSLVNQLLIHPRGIDHPERLAAIRTKYEGLGITNGSVSPTALADARNSRQIFDRAAIFYRVDLNHSGALTSSGSSAPERLRGTAVSAEFFDVFGAKPHLGRVFAQEEDQPNVNRVAVLAYGAWTSMFGADPQVLNRTIELDHLPFRIIGVMPASFEWPSFTDIWVPLGLPPAAFADTNRFNESYAAVVRMQPGVSIQQAGAWMKTVSDRVLNSDLPYAANAKTVKWGLTVMPFMEFAFGDTQTAVLILLGAVGLVLLIASSNVAGLMLARNSARTQELAVQSALGASRARLLSRTCCESLILALLGGAAGIAVALAGIRILLLLAPEGDAQGLTAHLDIYTLLFTGAVTTLSAALFGIVPAWHASAVTPFESLKGGGRLATGGVARQRLRSMLVVAEAAFALVLLVAAGGFLHSFVKLMNVNPGFESRGVMTATFSLPQTQYPDGPKEAVFYRSVVDRLAQTPGISAASIALGVPFAPDQNAGAFEIEGRAVAPSEANPHSDIRMVTPDYFRTLGLTLRSGRFFGAEDTFDGDRVVLIDENLARQFWPGQDPIGKRIRQGRAPWFTIAGVVSHVYQTNLAKDSGRGAFYYNLYQYRRRIPISTILVKGPADPATLAAAIREAVRNADPAQSVHSLKTMDDLIGGSVAPRRFAMQLMAFFAGTALLLAALGLYGVINYAVAQRNREIGIRVALGAGRSTVLRLIVGQGVKLTVWGVLIGLAGSAALAGVLENQLFGVRAFDPLVEPWIAAGAVAVLLAVTLLASYLPARRATRIDPLVALRCE